MNIGVDCDGVLTDMTAYICQYGEKWFRRKPVNPCGETTAEIFGCSEKEEFRFGLRYFFTYCRKWPPRENAAEVIERLGKDGHILYQITARKFAISHNPLGAYSRFLYRQWLEKNGFHFRDIFFCSEKNTPGDKLDGCRRFSVDVMIEDPPISQCILRRTVSGSFCSTRCTIGKLKEKTSHGSIIGMMLGKR